MLSKLLYSFRSRLDTLKRRADRRFNGLWLGPPPELLSQSDLLPGDVLFCGASNGGKYHQIIKEATDGAYVHCALYVGGGKIIDIITSGVRMVLLSEFVGEYSYLAVARCPGNINNLRRRRRVIKYCLLAVRGKIKGYNLAGAVLLPLREYSDLSHFGKWSTRRYWLLRKRIGRTRMFCSEFVANAYVDCGYIPKNCMFLHTHRLSPNGLAEENIFEFLGYISLNGWSSISRSDHFLAGCAWVLTEEGREKISLRRYSMLEKIEGLPNVEQFSPQDQS